MATLQLDGLVIKEAVQGESNKRITLLAKEYGKITISVRGGRNARSKFMAATQLYTYGHYVLHVGNGFYALNQAEILESYRFRLDTYAKLVTGMYLAELTDKLVLPEQPLDDLLLLLIASVQAIGRGLPHLLGILSVYHFKAMQLLGYNAQTDSCSRCGKNMKLKHQAAYLFSIKEGGIICTNCQPLANTKDAQMLTPGALEAIRYVLRSDARNVYRFSVAKDTQVSMYACSEAFLYAYHDMHIASMQAIKTLQSDENML